MKFEEWWAEQTYSKNPDSIVKLVASRAFNAGATAEREAIDKRAYAVYTDWQQSTDGMGVDYAEGVSDCLHAIRARGGE